MTAKTKWPEFAGRVMLADSPAGDLPADAEIRTPALYKSAIQLQLKAGVQILRAGTPQGIRLCREILGPDDTRQIWAASGPSGRLLALREVSESQLENLFVERFKTIVEAAPDALLLQSMTDADEAVVALCAAKKASALRVGVSVVYGSGADQMETVMAQPCEEVSQRLIDEGADLIGCNCGVTIDEMVLVVRLIREITDLPILACPDAGQRELEGDHIVHRETPEDFGSKISSLVSAGANVIGGCCGVSLEHLRVVAETLTR